ncbi:MAG: hypothetical protein IIZ48_00725 [Erysipelotrichales bacterium]|nr:hypothetical protein [Erysipelotrichales bacterium]
MIKKIGIILAAILVAFTVMIHPAAAYDNSDFSGYEDGSYPVRGKFDVQTLSNTSGSWYFEFNEDWFRRPATEYNHRLAKLSLGMALSAFRPGSDPLTLENPALHLQDFLKQSGFSNLRTDDYDKNPTLYTVSTVIAQKNIRDEEGEFTLIAVGVCGGGYKSEWLSNFTIGDNTQHVGFRYAAEEVYDRLFGYIAQEGLTKRRLKVWVSGFSRAAAVSNIFATLVDDSDMFDESDVFAYTFATPRTTKKISSNKYMNIFNICGKMDPVPQVPFADWGYDRYGTTFYTPAQQTDSDFLARQARAQEVFREITGTTFWNNVEWDTRLRVIMNAMLRMVPSSQMYLNHIQDKAISMWEDKSIPNIISQLMSIAEDPALINEENEDEANSLLTYVAYTVIGLFTQRGIDSAYLNPDASTVGNLAHEHIPDVYLAWMFSSDNPEEIFSSESRYIRLLVDGEADIIVTSDPEEATFEGYITADGQSPDTYVTSSGFVMKRNTGPEGSHIFIERRNGETIILIPRDRDYSVITHAVKDGPVTMTGNLLEVGRTNSDQSFQYVIKYIKAGSEDYIRLSTTVDYGDGDFQLVGGDTFDVTDFANGMTGELSLNLRAISFLNLSWRQIVILAYAAPVVILSLLALLVSWLVGRHRMKAKIKRGVVPAGTKYSVFFSGAIIAIVALFLIQELLYWLMPSYPVYRAILKLMIGCLSVYLAYLGYKRQPTTFSKFIMIALGILTAADITINYSFLFGMILNAAALIVLTIRFFKFDKPEPWQYITWIFSSAVCFFILNRYVYLFNTSVFPLYGYTAVMMAFLAASLTMPKKMRTGAVFLIIANFLLFNNEVRGATLLGHVLSLGIYYIGIICYSFSTRFKVRDVPKTEIPAEVSKA